jgi:hypothetical protein
MIIAGGIAASWGAVAAMTGTSSARVAITNDFSVTTLVVGLAGLAVLTVGLIWVRD